MKILSKNSGQWKSKISVIFIELLVVFVGVYSAFLLDDYRQQQRNELKRKQIYKSLLQDAEETSTALNQAIVILDSIYFDPFLESYNNKDMPVLKPLMLGTAGIRSNMWEAILKTGGLDVLDLKLITKMENYYFNFNVLVDLMKKSQQFSQQILIPNLDKPLSEFYDNKTKKLKKKYEWYLYYVKAIKLKLQEIHAQNEGLYAELENHNQ